MRAYQISSLDGPDALELVERPDPEPSHFMSPGAGVLIDVRTVGISFPDLLQSRGLYQMKPELPFVPGGEVAGTVVSASDGFSPGTAWPRCPCWAGWPSARSPRRCSRSGCRTRSTSPPARR